LAEELSLEGACERAIFPDSTTVIEKCAMIGNLSKEGVSVHSSILRCIYSFLC
jgi:hypothetical protein